MKSDLKLSVAKDFFTPTVLALFMVPFAVLAATMAPEQNTTDGALTLLVRHISELFFTGNLAVKDLEAELAITAEQSESGDSWLFKIDKYRVAFYAKALDKRDVIDELHIYMTDSPQLTLNDLEKLYGNSRVLAPGKDPWVAFDEKKNEDGYNVLIVAQVRSVRDMKLSPVLKVEMVME